MHDTPERRLPDAPAGCGLATIVQVVPFHRSTKVRAAPELEKTPTAKQFVALVHDTPASWLFGEPEAFGLPTRAQLTPFHRFVKVRVVPELL
jgi:hypothetical protein